MRLSLSCSATAAAVLLIAPHAHAQAPILPGYWDSTEDYSVVISGAAHDRKCLTNAQITRFIQSPSLKHYDCTYATRTLKDGRARFSGGVCQSKKGRKVLSDVALTGSFEPEAFHLNARFKLLLGGVGLPGTAEIDARRISPECPADPQPTR